MEVPVQPKPSAVPAPAEAGAPAGNDAKMEDAAPADGPVDAQQEAEEAAAGGSTLCLRLTSRGFGFSCACCMLCLMGSKSVIFRQGGRRSSRPVFSDLKAKIP